MILDLANEFTPLIIKRRKGTIDDPYVEKSESIIIKNNYIMLSEIPDSFTKIIISVDSQPLIETTKNILSENEYSVDYLHGLVKFHSFQNDKTAICNYMGTGVLYFPAESVFKLR